eukprot:scaffold12676_cov112-Isochrysis_galbana.AAC.10
MSAGKATGCVSERLVPAGRTAGLGEAAPTDPALCRSERRRLCGALWRSPCRSCRTSCRGSGTRPPHAPSSRTHGTATVRGMRRPGGQRLRSCCTSWPWSPNRERDGEQGRQITQREGLKVRRATERAHEAETGLRGCGDGTQALGVGADLWKCTAAASHWAHLAACEASGVTAARTAACHRLTQRFHLPREWQSLTCGPPSAGRLGRCTPFGTTMVFSLARAAMRHLALRWPVLPQISHALSRFGHSATACSVEPHAWHCDGSGHAPARWPTTPQLLHVLGPPPPRAYGAVRAPPRPSLRALSPRPPAFSFLICEVRGSDGTQLIPVGAEDGEQGLGWATFLYGGLTMSSSDISSMFAMTPTDEAAVSACASVLEELKRMPWPQNLFLAFARGRFRGPALLWLAVLLCAACCVLRAMMR